MSSTQDKNWWTVVGCSLVFVVHIWIWKHPEIQWLTVGIDSSSLRIHVIDWSRGVGVERWCCKNFKYKESILKVLIMARHTTAWSSYQLAGRAKEAFMSEHKLQLTGSLIVICRASWVISISGYIISLCLWNPFRFVSQITSECSFRLKLYFIAGGILG